MVDLIIFDVDGTLAETYTLDLLPNVQKFFELVFQSGCSERPKVAIATNQGGVGMRHWMETGGFGKPEKFPTRESVEERLKDLVAALGGDSSLPVYVSYRFQTKEGKWTPAPKAEAEDPRWQKEWRKPSPGMLLQAMQDASADPLHTLFVGDSPDDQEAAKAAGCAFEWAGEFFAREWNGCESLGSIRQPSD